MKVLRYKCGNCGAVKDIGLDGTFDNPDERTVHKRRTITKIFNPENQSCDHCGEKLTPQGTADVEGA